MGYLINPSPKDYLIFTFTNSELLIWDNTAPLILKNTNNFIVDQCTIFYTAATTPLTLPATTEINLTDSNNNIQYAFHSSGYSINNNEAIRLSGGNKSGNNVDAYNLSNELQLDCTTSVLSGDGQLIVYLWGTYV